MAASPSSHQGTEFPEDPFWYLRDEMSPPAQTPRMQTPRSGIAMASLETGCSIDQIVPLIESSEKARVIAALALNLLVFGGKLHHGRTNWACPFGHCKENFRDVETLMRHVPSCLHFSSDKVYCNCCNKDDCFAERTPNDHPSDGDESAASASDKGSPKKAKAMRKLTNHVAGFFSRASSRCSSRGSERPVSPNSTASRRSSIFSTKAPTPSPPVVELSGLPAASVSPPAPRHDVEALLSPPLHVFELSSHGDSRPHELPTSDGLHAAGRCSQRSDSTVSELSVSTVGTGTGMMIRGADMTESPAEDLSMDSKIPIWGAKEATTASFGQAPVEMANSHFQFFPASAHRPVSQHQADQHCQSTWTLGQQPFLQLDVQLSSRCGQDSLYSNEAIPVGNASFAILDQNPCLQPVASSVNVQPIASHHRQGSGDSGFSDGSHTTAASSAAFESSSQPGGHGRQPTTVPSTAVGTPQGFRSPSAKMDDLFCPYPKCTYQPQGILAGRQANLKKHIKYQHESEPVACPNCGKLGRSFNRTDNLATHQKTCCKRRLAVVPGQSGRGHAEMWMGNGCVDGSEVHAAKRARQDSSGAWSMIHHDT